MAVISTDDSGFDAELKNNSKVIVKYYADWCGTCKLFTPKFKRLSGDERFQGIAFLEVNAENNPEARKKGMVKSLPTFSVFKNGELLDSICTGKEDGVVELIEKLK